MLSVPVEQESCKQRALRMGEAMCKLPPLLRSSSYLGEIRYSLGSDHDACCHSFNQEVKCRVLAPAT